MIECSQILNNVTLYAETLDKKIQELESVKDKKTKELESFKDKFNHINVEYSKLINDLDETRQLNVDFKDEIKALRDENMKLKDNISSGRSEISELSKTNQILVERLHETQEEYLQAYSASIDKNKIIAEHIKLHKRNIKIFSTIKNLY